MEKKFDFFNDHSEQYLEMALGTDNAEVPVRPDGYGKNTGDCGDTIEIFLCAEGDIITDVSFIIDGCINTRACANTVALFVKNRPLGRAWSLQPEDIIQYLQTLPEDSHHCAELACGALYRALADLKTNIRDPWKKNYICR